MFSNIINKFNKYKKYFKYEDIKSTFLALFKKDEESELYDFYFKELTTLSKKERENK